MGKIDRIKRNAQPLAHRLGVPGRLLLPVVHLPGDHVDAVHLVSLCF